MTIDLEAIRKQVENLRTLDSTEQYAAEYHLCELFEAYDALAHENARLRSRLAEVEALLREESHEQYRFTQMTEYPSVTRMLLWHMDRRRRIDAFLASDSASGNRCAYCGVPDGDGHTGDCQHPALSDQPGEAGK